MKDRTRWTKESSRSLRTKLQKAGYKKVKVGLFGNAVNASFSRVDPFDRRKAERIGEQMGLKCTGGGTSLVKPRSDVNWQIRWRKAKRSGR